MSDYDAGLREGLRLALAECERNAQYYKSVHLDPLLNTSFDYYVGAAACVSRVGHLLRDKEKTE